MPADDERLDDDQIEGSENLKPENPIAKILKNLLSYLIPMLISVILSVIIMFMIFKGNSPKERNEEIIMTQLQPKPAPLSYYDLGEFSLNTADLDVSHFLRVEISLGYNTENKALHTELVARHTQIRDLILNLLNSKEKSHIDEFIEKEKLKEEIRRSINHILINGEVDAVYFTAFTIA